MRCLKKSFSPCFPGPLPRWLGIGDLGGVYELAVDWISRFHSLAYGIVRGRSSFLLEFSLTYSIHRVSLEHLSILVFRDGSACGTLRALRVSVAEGNVRK